MWSTGWRVSKYNCSDVLVVRQRRLDHINDDLIIGAVPGAASASWADQRSASDECSASDVDDLMTCGRQTTWERGAVVGLCSPGAIGVLTTAGCRRVSVLRVSPCSVSFISESLICVLRLVILRFFCASSAHTRAMGEWPW